VTMNVNGPVTVFILHRSAYGLTDFVVCGLCAIMPGLLHDVCALGYKILSFHLRLSTLPIPSSLPFPFSTSHFRFS